MKTSFIVALMLLANYYVSGQWTPGTGQVTTLDKVGIGFSSPISTLHVYSNEDTVSWPTVIANHRNSPTISNYGVGLMLKHSSNNELYKWGGVASIQESPWANTSGLALYANETEYLRIRGNGNVGIGTTSPDYKLDINGPIRLGINNASGLLVSRFTSSLTGVPGSTVGIQFSGPIHSHLVFDIQGNDHNDGFYVRVPSTLQVNPVVDKTAFVVKANAKVGIGTSTVDDKLHLKQVGGHAVLKIENTGNGNASIIKFSRERSTGEDIVGGAIGLVSNTANSSGQMFLNARSASAETGVDGSGSQVPFMTLGNGFDNNVAVGIGTTTPKNALDVAGTIRSTEVKVEATPWPDFVFDQDYQLPLLEEVKDYIDKNRHLPEIPSAVQVEEEGINLGEMNAKLLQKIEELTLYVIEINSEVQQLKLENEELKGMIAK